MIPEPAGMDDLAQQTRAAALRLLLETGRAVSATQIAAELNAAPLAVEGELRRLDAAGRIRLSANGQVLGSRPCWTWCAYDVVGIVGTLGGDARSLSRSPATMAPIRLQFAAGQPPSTPVVVFSPDDRGTARTIESAQRKMVGEVIELDEARRRGLAHWSPLLSANRGIESR
jgi:hypothetical protein